MTRSTISGTPHRRDVLKSGMAAATASLCGIPAAWSANTGATSTSAPRAKRCILIYLFGAAPQHETFDPKPDAPVEIQGEMKAIPTSVPGVAFCEGLPRTAAIADRLTVIRSTTHPFPLHGTAYALSGLPAYTTDLEAAPRDPRHWPYIGSVADHLWSRQAATSSEQAGLPRHIGLPWVFNSQADDLGVLAGPYSGFLSRRHDPVWAKFEGNATQVAPKCRHEQAKEYTDPYAAVAPDCRFDLDGPAQFPEGMSSGRFVGRADLLSRIESRESLPFAGDVAGYDRNRHLATALLRSPIVRRALDIQQEPAAVRENYGYTLFGQSCLAARRLAEAGTRFVSVFWDPYGTYFSGAWDTHQNHYPRLKQYLLPGFDRAYAALILDLEQRGLLDDTLVLCLTEHGRTPQIDSKPVGAARHHWSRVYSSVLAGGGVHRGAVIGRSDRLGGDVLETPISPKDILATSYHLLGFDPHAVIRDRQDRPFPIAGDGSVRGEVIA